MKQLNEIKDWREMINEVVCGDCLDGLNVLPDECVDCVITSPPYWALRDYGIEKQIGRETTFMEYVESINNVMQEVFRVLKPDGTLWLNLGDTYGGTGDKKEVTDRKNKNRNGHQISLNKNAPKKCLLQIPNRVAIMLCDNGWILRNEIIWHKPNAMPDGVFDRFTVDFEKVFLFSKNIKYKFNQQLVEYTRPINRWGGEKVKRLNGKDGYSMAQKIRDYRPNKEGKNMRTVWSINTESHNTSHMAVFPQSLVLPMLKAGSNENDIILDPFAGSGTTLRACKDLNRRFIGMEISKKYCEIADKRLQQEVML